MELIILCIVLYAVQLIVAFTLLFLGAIDTKGKIFFLLIPFSYILIFAVNVYKAFKDLE